MMDKPEYARAAVHKIETYQKNGIYVGENLILTFETEQSVLNSKNVEAVLLPLAHHWEFWYGPLDAVIYASFILAAKILWHLIDFGQSVRTATQINKQLRRRNKRWVRDAYVSLEK